MVLVVRPVQAAARLVLFCQAGKLLSPMSTSELQQPSPGADADASSGFHAAASSAAANGETANRKKMTVKVGLLGDQQIGKTSLMVKYVEGKFMEDYIQTLGVNFMEKMVPLKSTDVTFSVWDLGGQSEYLNMLPLVVNDSAALLFLFDLSRKGTLTSVKNWYKEARQLNKTARAFLIGTKFDAFAQMTPDEQGEITRAARKFAAAMKAPLIFCSASHSINIHKIFKIILSKVFDVKCAVEKITKVGDPILEFD